MPRKTDGSRYIMRLPEPMSRNICHGVPARSKDQLRALRLLSRTEMSHLHREIASFLHLRRVSLYITSLCRKREKERERNGPRKRKRERATSSILARKDPGRA